MRKALVNEAAGAVENIIELPDDPDPTTRPYTPPAGRILVDDDGTAQAGGSWDGVAFQPPPSSPLEEIRAAALLNVDTAAEAARQRFISPGDGKMLSYEAKRGEAESWAADDAPDPANYPWARSRAARLNGVAEIEVTVAQAQAVIDEWTARIADWRAAGIAIEHVSEGARDAIDIAVDIAAIDAVLDGLVWPAPV